MWVVPLLILTEGCRRVGSALWHRCHWFSGNSWADAAAYKIPLEGKATEQLGCGCGVLSAWHTEN